MFNLTTSYFNDIKERAVLAGASITEEAMALVYADDGAGGVAVQPSTGAAGEQFAGFAITDALKVVTEAYQETSRVPAVAPFTLQLKNLNILTPTFVRVYDSTAAAVLPDAGGAPAAGQSWTQSNGLVTFNAAEAGNSVVITYRYTLTAAQIQDKYHGRCVNNTAQDYFSTVSVGCDDGEIFTSLFDTSQAYVAGVTNIRLGSNGILTSTGVGEIIGLCTKIPNDDDALLGVKFKTK